MEISKNEKTRPKAHSLGTGEGEGEGETNRLMY